MNQKVKDEMCMDLVFSIVRNVTGLELKVVLNNTRDLTLVSLNSATIVILKAIDLVISYRVSCNIIVKTVKQQDLENVLNVIL